jgi:hypothetical protein
MILLWRLAVMQLVLSDSTLPRCAPFILELTLTVAISLPFSPSSSQQASMELSCGFDDDLDEDGSYF